MKIIIIIVIIGLFGTVAFNSLSEKDLGTPTIESVQGVELYGYENCVLLDVRTLNEHRAKSIPNTPIIPIQELESRINELTKYKDKKIVVYCRSGNRSKRGTDILNSHGFDAVNLAGGMNKWKGAVISGE